MKQKSADYAKPLQETKLWDCYNGLLISPDIDRIRKLLVRNDLFQMAMTSPGDIFECGVFKGAGAFYWLKLLAIYAPTAQKRVVGFDTFGAFADSLLDYEKKSAAAYVAEANFAGTAPEDLMVIAHQAGLGNRLELVAGDIMETAPKYVADNPGFRISLLHLDFDTYNGTKAALESFYPAVSPGGLIVLDEYGKRGWGESDAVDEFIRGKGIKLEAINTIFQPTAFFRKPPS
jgi:hypothetical protein